jgi:ribose-phosphate pyrophosphokinase
MTITDDDRNTMVTRAEAKLIAQRAVARALESLSRAPRPFKMFGLNGSQTYAAHIAQHLGRKLTPHVEKIFEDGELYVKPTSEKDGNVRGHNIFVVQSLYSDDLSACGVRLNQLALDFAAASSKVDPTNADALSDFVAYLKKKSGETVSDKFMKLCIMCGALRDASAHEVTVVIPHLAWARQDRKTESRAPITTKYVAQMLEAVGVERALFMDVHNLAAEQNAFRFPIDNLETKNLHAAWCVKELNLATSKRIAVLTPDSGGLARCVRFRNSLAHMLGTEYEDDIPIVIYDKVRSKGKVVGSRIIGDVRDVDVIAYDDMISTGGTMQKACQTVLDEGGNLRAICAAHGLFCGKANEVMDPFDTKIVVADTMEPFRLNEDNRKKVVVLDTTKMVADAIMKIHSGTGSISELLDVDRL